MNGVCVVSVVSVLSVVDEVDSIGARLKALIVIPCNVQCCLQSCQVRDVVWDLSEKIVIANKLACLVATHPIYPSFSHEMITLKVNPKYIYKYSHSNLNVP